MKYLHVISSLALISFLAVCSLGAYRLLSIAGRDLWEFHDVLTKLDSAATASAEMANEEKSQVRLTVRELNKTLSKANDLLGHADIALVGRHGDGGIARTVNDSVTESIQLQKTVASSFTSLDPTLQNFSAASSSLATNLPPIMSSLIDTTKDASVTSRNLAATTDSARITMQSVQKGVTYEVDELMKPVKKIKVIGEELVRLAGKFLGY